MIVVTGTKRSGTSMWMQVLKAAGFPVLGAEFLGKWKDTIRDANRRGFYESPLRRGIYYATNPHPESGAFLPPGRNTSMIAVKVFIPGVVRSDVSYLNRVIASMRHWREYAGSIERMASMEREALAKEGKERNSIWLPPLVEWWLENFMLVRDVATRGYPLHLVTYDRMLSEPRAALEPILKWLGHGDLDAAVAAVSADERTQKRTEAGATSLGPIAEEHGDVFDALYQRAHAGEPLDAEFITRLNETHTALVPEIENAQREVLKTRAKIRQQRMGELDPDVVEILVHGPEGDPAAVPGSTEQSDEFVADG